MTSKSVPACCEHQIQKECRQATIEYSEDWFSVLVSGVYTWVCSSDGEASFAYNAVDELITTERERFKTAHRGSDSLYDEVCYST
jgi:hypothetical protein